MPDPRTYATQVDLKNPAMGLPALALTRLTAPDMDEALLSASDLADSYLQSRFKLPIIKWGRDLSQAVCAIAAYNLLAGRGMNPQTGSADEQVRLRYEDAIRWLEKCAKGIATPAGLVDSTPTPEVGLVNTETPIFTTNQKRGWG